MQKFKSPITGKLVKDYTGIKSGYLTAIKPVGKLGKRNGVWEFECVCGKKLYLVPGNVIRSGRAGRSQKSCGCAQYVIGRSVRLTKGYEEVSGGFFAHLKRNAKNRGIYFDLKIQDIWDKYIEQKGVCALSGVPIKFAKTRTVEVQEGSVSVDRIDSKLNYSVDNIQLVHKKINRIKLDHTDQEFINWCTLVANHNKNLENK